MTKGIRSLAVAVLLSAACTTPTAGNVKKEGGTSSDPAAQERLKALWAATTVGVGIGEAHNLVPQETEMVKAAVEMRKRQIKECFEQPVLKRGCRTGGLPAQFDAMLMITSEGFIRDTRIVPNKNDLPKECYDGVNCVQDELNRIQVIGLQRFQGARQAYMTVTLQTPDEAALGAADAGN
ncbi:MAG: hypothetical protein HY907_05300 [Deltaproteobacteria bacterium]|nr:hypothetical protein [Deltaproteobacteria bacterium]